MAIPRIDPDPTALDRVTGGSAITTTTSIEEALVHLRRSGEPGAVVYQAGRPVGVVTAAALIAARDGAHSELPVAALMDYVAVPVDAHADTLTIVHRFSQAAWDWLKHTRA
jgi:hypothetical protein